MATSTSTPQGQELLEDTPQEYPQSFPHHHESENSLQSPFEQEEEYSLEKEADRSDVDNEESTNIFVVYFKKLRAYCGKIVDNTIFQNFILSLILINAVMMGIGTYDFITTVPKYDNAFSTTDTVFLYIFSIELVLQIIHKGFYLFKDGWLVFDFLTVVTSWSFQQFQVIRAFRVFRALRLIARIAVLKDLIVALLSVLPRVGAIIALMLLIFYIFAVMFTSLFKDIDIEPNYFRRLDATFLTLFQMVTLDWAEIARELMEEVSWARYPIIAFILISSFIVYNLIVAVLCDAIFVLSEMKEKNDDDESILSEDEASKLQHQIDDLTSQVAYLREGQTSMRANVATLAIALSDMGIIKRLPVKENSTKS